MVNRVIVDQENCLPVEGVDGHVSDIVSTIGMWPDRDDDKFSEVEVGRCTDEFWDRPQRWGEVFHDASDRGIGKSFKFLAVRNGTDGVG